MTRAPTRVESIAPASHLASIQRNWPSAVVLLLVINTAIAALLSAINLGGTFAENLLFSQCIGITIASFCSPVLVRARGRRPNPALTALAVATGAPVGVYIATAVHRALFDTALHDHISHTSILLGLFFGSVVTVIAWMHERLAHTQSVLSEERALAEKAQTETQLRLLQAQIEPHFLFNTLAGVSSLVDAAPKDARRMLERLNDYLRASLAHSRQSQSTLGDEVRLLEPYLDIMAMRMGPRLQWTVDVPDDLRALPFPPMLLQPLVENAIRHGLEPKVAGGSIRIEARHDAGRLVVRVLDTGCGLCTSSSASTAGSGVGLSNVRERLAALYGGAGRLSLAENAPAGVVATLEIPA